MNIFGTSYPIENFVEKHPMSFIKFLSTIETASPLLGSDFTFLTCFGYFQLFKAHS